MHTRYSGSILLQDIGCAAFGACCRDYTLGIERVFDGDWDAVQWPFDLPTSKSNIGLSGLCKSSVSSQLHNCVQLWINSFDTMDMGFCYFLRGNPLITDRKSTRLNSSHSQIS